jgi:hypothetical protein
MLFKNLYYNANYKWIDIIQNVITAYNNRIHRTIKMKPIDVTKKHEKHLLQTVFKPAKPSKKKPKLKVNDIVRVSLLHSCFKKLSIAENWSTKLYRIKKVIYKQPPIFKLENIDGSPHLGTYVEHELMKTKYPEHYLVEKVLKRKNGKMFVKFFNFDATNNCWIDEN